MLAFAKDVMARVRAMARCHLTYCKDCGFRKPRSSCAYAGPSYQVNYPV